MEVINGRSVYAGQIYRHFKNKLYQIIAVANHSETGEKLVIYQQLYGKYEVYARPLEMFMSEVDRTKYPMAEQKYRFELVERQELPIINQADYFFKKEEQKNEDEGIIGKESQTDEFNISSSEIPEEIKEKSSIDEADRIKTIIEETEDETVNPYLIKFLDADTYEEKRNILIRIKGEMTNRLIDDIAASLDVAVDNGDIEERYISLLNCIDMMVRFEVNRFR